MLAALGFVLGIEAEVDQGVMALAGFDDNVTSVSAVAPGGSAARNELFAAKRHASITTVTGLDPNFGFINKHSLFPV